MVAWGFDEASQRMWIGRYFGLPATLNLNGLSFYDMCRIVTLGLINPTRNMLAWQIAGWVRTQMMRFLRRVARAAREEMEDKHISQQIQEHGVPPSYIELIIRKFLRITSELVHMLLLEVSPLLAHNLIAVALDEATTTGIKPVVDNAMALVLYRKPIVLDDTTGGDQDLPNQEMADSPVGKLDVDTEVGVGPSMDAEAEGPAVLEAEFAAGTAEAVASTTQVATPVAPAVIDASPVSGPIPVVEEAASTPSSPPLQIQDKGKKEAYSRRARGGEKKQEEGP